MPARFIALEGIDQSGKKTQAQLLTRKLRREGFKVATLSFPIYSSPAGQEIRAFLEGRRKLSPQAVHMLYSLNRWENGDLIDLKLRESDYVIADRYTASNLAYGLARGLGLEWLLNLDKGLRQPDKVIVLDVPVPASFNRKTRGRDVHESDRKLLLRVRKAYLALARRFHWTVINGEGPALKVHSDIWASLAKNSPKTATKPAKNR